MRAHVEPASSLRRSLPKWTVAQAHRRSVRRFTQRIMRLLFLYQILKRKSLRPPLLKTVCFFFLVLSYAERIFLSILISLYFVMQSSCSSRRPSQLAHRRSCYCTEAVGHPPFSVPSGSHAPVVALPQNFRSVLFEVPLVWGKSLPLVAAIFSY